MTKEEVESLDLSLDDEAALEALVLKLINHEDAEEICEGILKNCSLVRLQLEFREKGNDIEVLRGILPTTIDVMERTMNGFSQEVAQVRDDLQASLASTEAGVYMKAKTAIEESIGDFTQQTSQVLERQNTTFNDVIAQVSLSVNDLIARLSRNYREWLENAAGLASEEYAQSQLNRNMEQYIRELNLLKERFTDILGDGLSASDVLKELTHVLLEVSDRISNSVNTKTGASYARVLVDALSAFKTKNVKVSQSEGKRDAIY